MKFISECPGHRVVALVVCTLFISGCSSSGDSSSIDFQSTSDVPDVVPDPMVQTRTQVDFEITVPAYQSNELQVKLTWGDLQASAEWVGDQIWSWSEEFSTDTEHQLTIWFYDRNGAIPLGRFQADFRTGINSSESYQVRAEQFDTAQWDIDGDGVSNLNELIAGTDPTVNELELVEVRESFELATLGRDNFIFFERLIPAQRPYYQDTEDPPITSAAFAGVQSITVIDLDEFGTGSYLEDTESYEPPYSTFIDRTATRTNTGDSIIWSGIFEYYYTGSGYREIVEFTIESRVIDERTRSQEAAISIDRIGGFVDSNGYNDADISYTLVGEIIDDSSWCKPDSGNVTVNYRGNSGDLTVNYTKEITDQYWSNAGGEFARTLGDSFWCNYLDL